MGGTETAPTLTGPTLTAPTAKSGQGLSSSRVNFYQTYYVDFRHYSSLTSLETMSASCPTRYASTNLRGIEP